MSWRRRLALVALAGMLGSTLLDPAGVTRAQRYAAFTTPTPLGPSETLVLGFLGGRDAWNDDRRAVRALALRLRAMELPGVRVETVENTKRAVALRLIREAFDRNSDGRLDDAERAGARLIVYGQSFGGAAVVKLAKQLEELGVPILLTVQIDSVGMGDAVIPPNVRRAANLYQDSGWIIEGEAPIRAADPERTEIIGNFEYDYRDSDIDISHVSFWRKFFRYAHTRMEFDAAVWSHVETLILGELRGSAAVQAH